MDLIAHSLTPGESLVGIRSLVRFGKLVGPLAHPVLYPRRRITRGCTSIHFGENQLSPSLIGLSPLPTDHPSGFQPTTVRASTGSYPCFTLSMGRSPGFGSTACN
jgi:hypothetical protein